MLASLIFLSPTAALVGIAALLPVGAFFLAERRVARVRRLLTLRPPPGGADLTLVASLVAVVLVLALAAAQPAWARRSTTHVRTDAQALFVVDTSASMAASAGPSGAVRLERAKAAARRLRAAIPEIPSGVATLTDRVLPNLLPAPDRAAFDATLARAVAINEPPPRELNPRATSFSALASIPGAGYFDESAKHRAIVLLTDGETTPLAPATVARALRAAPRSDLLAVQFWRKGEAIYGPGGRSDPNYRADPSSKAALASLAAASGGRVFGEGDPGAAARYLRSLFGEGPTRSVGKAQRTHPLAPYVALLALVPLALVFRGRVAGPGP
jgi:hypothetical protein